MRIPLTADAVVTFVTVSALFGMVLGGAFGVLAAQLAPDFFVHLVSWATFRDPAGIAIMLGSFGGVLCGGLLGGFAVAVQVIGRRIPAKREAESLERR